MLFMKTERQAYEEIRAQGLASIYSYPSEGSNSVGSIYSVQTGVGWTSWGMAGYPGGEQNQGLQLPYSHLWRTSRSVMCNPGQSQELCGEALGNSF